MRVWRRHGKSGNLNEKTATCQCMKREMSACIPARYETLHLLQNHLCTQHTYRLPPRPSQRPFDTSWPEWVQMLTKATCCHLWAPWFQASNGVVFVVVGGCGCSNKWLRNGRVWQQAQPSSEQLEECIIWDQRQGYGFQPWWKVVCNAKEFKWTLKLYVEKAIISRFALVLCAYTDRWEDGKSWSSESASFFIVEHWVGFFEARKLLVLKFFSFIPIILWEFIHQVQG